VWWGGKLESVLIWRRGGGGRGGTQNPYIYDIFLGQ
tara:strand:- start:473 stop:580 length:108 start_codon:yes stop_codon:yes gene_type:complete